MTDPSGRPDRPGLARRPQAPAIEGVAVVVPVHDEEDLLPACLASIERAVAHPALDGIATVVVVVLDACRDTSPDVAARQLRSSDVVLEIGRRNVGAARAAGTDRGLVELGLDPGLVWTAHTDADTTVPEDWLVTHLALAADLDGVAGLVRVDDWSVHHRATRLAFDRDYRGAPGEVHPHVHGANLGVRGSAYRSVGGFPELACGEDHALWDALRGAGVPVRSSRRSVVTTSARRTARAAGGFADRLLDLERQSAWPGFGVTPPAASGSSVLAPPGP